MTRIIAGQVAYKLVRVGRPNCKTHFYKFNIPAEIGDLIPDDTRFFVEVCEEGILLRRTEQAIEQQKPSWLRSEPSACLVPPAEPNRRANGVGSPVGNEGGQEAQKSGGAAVATPSDALVEEDDASLTAAWVAPPDTLKVIKKRGYSRSGR